MKTLEQIKNDYAISKGYDCWESLFGETSYYENNEFFNHENEVMVIIQKECLKLASENAKLDSKYFDGEIYYRVNKQSITNENNIIK